VSLVGYTNAGKSTLFNQLTQSDVYTADQLFATLDPTNRRIELPHFGPVIVTDTVGFIRHLPHNLVAAFQATLLATSQADLLLHVIDVTDDNLAMHLLQVDEVLKEIGAADVPVIEVFNKIDLLDEHSPRVEVDPKTQVPRVWLSAQNRIGLSELEEAVVSMLGQCVLRFFLTVPHLEWNDSWSRLAAQLHEHQCVLKQSSGDVSTVLDVVVAESLWRSLCRECPICETIRQS